MKWLRNNWPLLALFGAGGFVLYRVFNLGNKALDKATGGLARLYVYLGSSGRAIPQGQILLPNGQLIPLASVAAQSIPGSNFAQFQYGYTTYYLKTPHDEHGNWEASSTL